MEDAAAGMMNPATDMANIDESFILAVVSTTVYLQRSLMNRRCEFMGGLLEGWSARQYLIERSIDRAIDKTNGVRVTSSMDGF